MKLIKLFEQFVSEESEAEDASMTKPKTVLNPQTLLDNKSEEYNEAIGVSYDHVPSSFRQDNGEIFGQELDWIVDFFDSPFNDASSTNTLVQWIKGGSAFRLDPDASNKPLKYRTTNQDGIIYPAVEDLRVSYNLDENFETLGSAASEFGDIKKLLLECYQHWISSVDNSKFNPTGDDLIPKFAKS